MTKPDGRDDSRAVIRQLTITRFRGIECLKWNPAPGLNIILGGGDAGKTTILEAIALLLNPSNSALLSEADYHDRNTELGFVIQAVLSLPMSSDISQQQKFAWPWEWNGKEAVPPALSKETGDDIPTADRPVYCIRVRGTSDLELSWEIVQPNDDIDILSSAVRRSIGLVRLGADDRNDRDLRLVYGSALDRLLSDRGLKARLGQQVSEIDLNARLGEEGKKSLKNLEEALRDDSLPSGLELGLTSAQGLSIGALVGLLAEKKRGTSLPLASWGAGTRRMATLHIAAATQAKTRIAVVDEIERGLEPYRVRKLVENLQAERTQNFATTHSPIVINVATESAIWYLDSRGNIGELSHDKIARQQQRDPETFITRLSIIAEGPTEVGFASHFLEKVITSPRDHGIRVCNGQGTPAVLDLLEAMNSGGLVFGGFVDAATVAPTRWKTLKTKMGDLLFQWESGCTEERVISLIDEHKLIELIKSADGKFDAERRRTLAERLNLANRSIESIIENATDLRALIIAAATGSKVSAPDEDTADAWARHGRHWFKSKEGGRELAEKALKLGVWSKLKPTILPFLNSVRMAVGQPATDDIDP